VTLISFFVRVYKRSLV